MRIYVTREFKKWARKNEVLDSVLVSACGEIEGGLVEVDLGSNLKKKRIALGGSGKRGGGRVLVCFKSEHLCIFLYGYCKNKISNLANNEIDAFKAISRALLQFSDSELLVREKNGSLIRVRYEK